MPKAIKATVWNEFKHETSNAEIATIYPDGIHGAIAAGLNAGIIAELDAISLYEQMAASAQNESIKKALLAVAG